MENETNLTGPRPVSADALGNARWQFRRTVIIISLVFCATVITYLTIYGDDTRLHESIANGTLLLAGTIIGSYVFGAVWDDKGIRDFKR